MRIIRRTATVPAALGLLAAAALTGWSIWKCDARPRPVAFAFPENAPAPLAVADLRSCSTIEEAMLFKVMGTIQNLSPRSLRYPTVQVAFLDARGQTLDHSQGCVIPEVLEPQDIGRFVLVTRPDPRIATAAITLADPAGRPLPAEYSLRDPPLGFVHP